MTPVTGIVRNGRIEIDAPNGCLEGAEVRLWLEATEASASMNGLGVIGDEELKLLSAMKDFEPLVMTEDEESKFNQALKDQRDWELSKFESQASQIESLWK